MYATSENTVRSHKARPLLTGRNISTTSAARSYKALMDYHKSSGAQLNIGQTAVSFYLLNHAISLVNQSFAPDQELPPEHHALYTAYHKEAGAIGVRMFHDILYMLTTMASFTHPDSYHFDWIETDFGPQTKAFAEAVAANKGNNTWWTPNFADNKAVLSKALMESEGVSLAQAVGALTYIVDVRQKELAYGPLWRDVGKMLLQFIHGVKSLESTIDTSFTYCHCNGSFFEKGHFFQAVGNSLFEVLDVQRAGLIPQFVNEGKNPLANAALPKRLHSLVAPLYPEVFKGAMKWSDVHRVSQKELVFPNKYKQAFGNALNLNGGGGGANGVVEKPVPKIFSPIDEDSYLDMTKGIGSNLWR